MTQKKVSQLGKYERDMITQIMGLLPKLEFATHRRRKSDGVMVDVYDIPDDRKAELIRDCLRKATGCTWSLTVTSTGPSRSSSVTTASRLAFLEQRSFLTGAESTSTTLISGMT